MTPPLRSERGAPASLRRRAVAAGLAIAAIGAVRPPASARDAPLEPFEGTALDVQDGDSFTLRSTDGRRLRIRVSGIDAPERHQPFADDSRRHLGEMLRGRRLRVIPVKHDRFGRVVARVDVLGGDASARDAGLAQIEAGLAWHFRRYASDQPAADRVRYARAERDARERRLGLWAQRTPEAPWEFRSRTRRDEPHDSRRGSANRAE